MTSRQLPRPPNRSPDSLAAQCSFDCSADGSFDESCDVCSFTPEFCYRAGPRAKIYFEPAEVHAAIVTAGYKQRPQFSSSICFDLNAEGFSLCHVRVRKEEAEMRKMWEGAANNSENSGQGQGQGQGQNSVPPAVLDYLRDRFDKESSSSPRTSDINRP